MNIEDQVLFQQLVEEFKAKMSTKSFLVVAADKGGAFIAINTNRELMAKAFSHLMEKDKAFADIVIDSMIEYTLKNGMPNFDFPSKPTAEG